MTVTAPSGVLSKNSGKLVLSNPSKRVVWFTDAPQRQQGTFRTTRLATVWPTYGFVADQPNASIVGTGRAGRTISFAAVLGRPAISHGSLTFPLSALGPPDVLAAAKSLTDVSVFIDNGSTSQATFDGTVTVAGGGPVSGAAITVAPECTSGTGCGATGASNTFTDASGSYRYSTPCTATTTYTVGAYSQGFGSLHRTVSAACPSTTTVNLVY